MKVKLRVTPKIYCEAYFTPGVHTKPQWLAKWKFTFWPDGETLDGDKGNVISPESHTLVSIYSGSFDTPEEAIADLKKMVDMESVDIQVEINTLELGKI